MAASEPVRGVGSWLKGLFRRRDPEAERRKWLLSHGRIVEGKILDLTQDASTTVSYRYDVSGVSYESSQTLDAEQLANFKKYVPGCSVSIRYDPRRPANSMLV